MDVPAGYKPVWIQGASVLINETTGAILVDAQVSAANTVLDGADAAQGTTTDTPFADSTTKESDTARTGISLWKRVVNILIDVLATIKANLLTCGKITVSADATLNTLLGMTVNASIKRLLLIPRTSNAVYVAFGAAATNASALLPAGGLGIGCDSTIGTTLHLYSASSVVVDIYQFG